MRKIDLCSKANNLVISNKKNMLISNTNVTHFCKQHVIPMSRLSNNYIKYLKIINAGIFASTQTSFLIK